MSEREMLAKFGVRYFSPGERGIYEASPGNLYWYKAFFGEHAIQIGEWESLCYLDGSTAHWRTEAGIVASKTFAVLMRGYRPPARSVEVVGPRTSLPYVNGCSTRQLFTPERLGDPTLQLLEIPPYSAEQAHHIHSTVRVVHILKGQGKSIVGMEQGTVETDLVEGLSLVLEPMCPHHFSTPQGEHLLCMPFHVFSSVGALESNHPMFNGTHLMNQGE